MENEQDELQLLRERMVKNGMPDYTIDGKVVYWRGQSIGNIDYLTSRREDQLTSILDLFKGLAAKQSR